MKSFNSFRSLFLLFLLTPFFISCDPNDGLEKYQGTWVHKNSKEKLPDDTLHIENLGNGNAQIKVVVAKSALFADEGYRLNSNTLTGTYNPKNDRIDLPKGEPIIYNPNTQKLSLVDSEWMKVD